MHQRAAVIGLFAFLTATGLDAQDRKPPKKPDQPFKVFVFTEGLTNEDVNMPAVSKEVAKRIGKKKKWLKVVDSRDEADIVVEVLTHAVHEQHRTRLESRVNVGGVGKSWIDNNFLTESHYIETRVDFPDGTQQLLRGVDERERGGSLKGAASRLAKNLEERCKENYWAFVAT